MRLFKFLFISVLLLLIQLQIVNAQSAHSFLTILEQAESTNSTIRIELKDGYDFYESKLLSFSKNSVTIHNSAGSISINFDRIDEIRIINISNNEKLWFPLHSDNRLFIYPTAISSKAEKGYIRNFYLFYTNFSFNPIKNLSMNLVVSHIPTLETTLDVNILSFGLKYSLRPFKDIHIAISANRYNHLIDDINTFITFFTLGTYSYNNTDFTLGLGFGANDGEIFEHVALFGLQTRFSERLIFVTENLILPSFETPVFSAGPRFLGKNISTDIGFFFLPDEFKTVPFISFTTTF